ncbi:MAG: phosphoenolpyruvate--protein phosphotransferase [Planctomycetaceae bacterium]|nr:phosphoenolpyruvate--protein phosphotransferase [Planctomycetaceae bacterium]
MQKLQGIAVSPGVAVGEAFVLDNEGFRIPRRFVARDAVDSELDRLNRAFEETRAQTESHRDTVARELGPQYAAIFDAHLQMLGDARLRAELDESIRVRHYSPEYAVSRVLRRYARVFQSLESSFLAERSNDIVDIERRLLRVLLGKPREELSNLTSPVLILAYNLTPSETAALDRRFVMGFVTEIGGAAGHTAIVAEGMEIPAVVGTGPFLNDVSGGDLVIVDGNSGLVILQPDEETIARYRFEVEQERRRHEKLEELRDVPAETLDGTRIHLMGNIEFPSEAPHCLERAVDGIGLYRTEFLYLGSDAVPGEEDHYKAYADVVQAMQGRPVVIRTLDLGADKLWGGNGSQDSSPLGLRSIRLSLRNVPLFKTQLRALLRAAALGEVHIMFPLISSLHELRQAKMILADVVDDLVESGLPFSRNVKVGMMVEVPSAVIMLDQFVEEVDFLSIGTNDLIQYTLAVDRGNKDVADLYSSSDPALLRLIDMTIRAAERRNLPVSLCGQMSGSTTYTMLLLGLGLRCLSVPPSAVYEIKRVIRSVTVEQCRATAARALTMENARNIRNFLKEELKKVLPESHDDR